MSNLGYSVQEWKDAYEQAEISDFKDGADLHDWPLAQFLCGTVAASETARKDPVILQGIINMLEAEGFESFSAGFLVTVLSTANGTTTDDFQELSSEWAGDHLLLDDYPNAEDMEEGADWEIWYRDHAMRSTEVYGKTDAGGTLYWFDRKDTW